MLFDPRATAFSYQTFCAWPSLSSSLHAWLAPEKLFSEGRALGGPAAAQNVVDADLVGYRAKQIGVYAGAVASACLLPTDLVFGTGCDRGVYCTAPAYKKTLQDTVKSYVLHPQDTGLAGLGMTAHVGLCAGAGAALGAALGYVTGQCHRDTSQGPEAFQAMRRTHLEGCVSDGIVAGTIGYLCAGGGLAQMCSLGAVRLCSALTRLAVVLPAMLSGAVLGAAIGFAELGLRAAGMARNRQRVAAANA